MYFLADKSIYNQAKRNIQVATFSSITKTFQAQT